MMRKEPYGLVLKAGSPKMHHVSQAVRYQVVPLEWFGELVHKTLGPDNEKTPNVIAYFADTSYSNKPKDVYPRDWEGIHTYADLTKRCFDPIWKNRLVRIAKVETSPSDSISYEIKWAWSFMSNNLVVLCRSALPVSPSGIQMGMSYAVTLADLCREQFNKVQVRPIFENTPVFAGY